MKPIHFMGTTVPPGRLHRNHSTKVGGFREVANLLRNLGFC
jgi:hypothetical protein